MDSQLHLDVDNAESLDTRPVDLFWDVEDMHLPKKYDAHKLMEEITAFLKTKGYHGNLKIHAVAHLKEIKKSLRKAMEANPNYVVDSISEEDREFREKSCGRNRNGAKVVLSARILEWMVNKRKSRVLIIASSNIHFLDIVKTLVGFGHEVCVVLNGPKISRKWIKATADDDRVWLWSDVINHTELQDESTSKTSAE